MANLVYFGTTTHSTTTTSITITTTTIPPPPTTSALTPDQQIQELLKMNEAMTLLKQQNVLSMARKEKEVEQLSSSDSVLVRNEMVEQNKKLQLDVHNLVKVSTPLVAGTLTLYVRHELTSNATSAVFFVLCFYVLCFLFSVCSFCVGFKKPVPKSH